MKTRWSTIMDKKQLMRVVLQHIRDEGNYPRNVVDEKNVPEKQIKISITEAKIISNEFELWVEFVVPEERGVVVGTHVYSMNLSGEIVLKETYGVILVPQDLN